MVLYDGLCKVCLANRAMLEWQDAGRRLRFVNIAGEDYDPKQYLGIDYADAMSELHVIFPGGEVARGVDAVFRTYDAVGLAWAVGFLSSDLLRGATDALYKVVSENRYFVSEWMPGGDALREWLRSARFLQKGLAEGEGCSDDGDDEEDCTVKNGD